MKIMHTADWHLGKHLEGNSRLDEQKKMLRDIVEIAEDENIDLVMIAGDIYDTFNPPAAAEQLFYRTMEELSDNGDRIIVLISGNHDSPSRLGASLPLAIRQGIIIVDRPDFYFEPGQVGNHQLVAGENGYLELKINGETAVILTVPYPSESRLDLLLGNLNDERVIQQNYSAKVKEIFAELSEHYRQDTINLAMSHIFVAGSEESKSERPIQVGGGLTVAREALPAKSDYTALGHLHRSQPASSQNNAYYAGSPLQYSLSELNQSKSVKVIEASPDSRPEINTRQLRNPKPIEVWEVDNIDDAYKKCKDNEDRDVWAYLKIKTDRPLRRSEIKELKKIKEDILSIIPITPDSNDTQDLEIEEELNIKELFQEFYQKEYGVQPEEEVMEMFQEIIDVREGQHEAGNS